MWWCLVVRVAEQEAQDRKPVKGLRYFMKRVEAQAKKDAKDFERVPGT